MKITQKQLLVMWDVLRHASCFAGEFAGYSRDTLNKLINEIINQQSTEPKDYGEQNLKQDINKLPKGFM